MKKTLFNVTKMDCPSEERLIRMAFEGNTDIKKLEFDLLGRKLQIYHEGDSSSILSVLTQLGLGPSIVNSEEVKNAEQSVSMDSTTSYLEETRVLKQVFVINAVMFFAEFIAGLIAHSTGLLADSLDMFADASVFSISLYAVGKTINLKKRAARFSGYLQMALAIVAFVEIIRKFILGSEPEALIMITVAAIALFANAICMWLLVKYRKGEVHMQASWIFLSNDVIANAGVIFAGILVKFTGSHIPDLIVGTLIAAIVFWGSIRILRVARY